MIMDARSHDSMDVTDHAAPGRERFLSREENGAIPKRFRSQPNSSLNWQPFHGNWNIHGMPSRNSAGSQQSRTNSDSEKTSTSDSGCDRTSSDVSYPFDINMTTQHQPSVDWSDFASGLTSCGGSGAVQVVETSNSPLTPKTQRNNVSPPFNVLDYCNFDDKADDSDDVPPLRDNFTPKSSKWQSFREFGTILAPRSLEEAFRKNPLNNFSPKFGDSTDDMPNIFHHSYFKPEIFANRSLECIFGKLDHNQTNHLKPMDKTVESTRFEIEMEDYDDYSMTDLLLCLDKDLKKEIWESPLSGRFPGHQSRIEIFHDSIDYFEDKRQDCPKVKDALNGNNCMQTEDIYCLFEGFSVPGKHRKVPAVNFIMKSQYLGGLLVFLGIIFIGLAKFAKTPNLLLGYIDCILALGVIITIIGLGIIIYRYVLAKRKKKSHTNFVLYRT